MDSLGFFLVFSFILACIHLLCSNLLCRKSNHTNLPPGPCPLPIIGNILKLGNKPHQALANLSKTYGPLMTLKLGSITTIVISSPEIAKEALHKHDQALSSRTIPDAITAHDHHNHSMAWLPALGHWKNLRRIGASQLFTSKCLDASQGLRRKNVQELMDYVTENCVSGRAVDIGRAAFTTVLNLMSNTFFSIDLATYNSNLSQEFNDLASNAMEVLGKPNLADYFPILRIVDPQGARRRTTNYFGRILGVIDDIINERTQICASSTAPKETNDVLDSLLILANENNPELSFLDVKHTLLDFFIGGTDTTASTVEWAMAELLHNPEKFAKLKTELKGANGQVQECDISKFPYLQAVLKETFRLHPPFPFLLPRKAQYDVEISGFKVPKTAQVLVNVWAMGQDSSIWPNPNLFIPERFLESSIDMKGTYFELIPFGAGRRICPGLPLAHRMMHLMLASLIHSFDWKVADGMKPEDMDMSEQFGLSLHRTKPLLAVPIKV